MKGAALLKRVAAHCLALPEAEEKPFGGHTAPAYRVRDKMFVSVSEARDALTMKGRPGVQDALVGSDPKRFFVPKYVGSKGWIGINVTVDQDWEEIVDLIEESYRMTAPKRLAAQLDTPGT